MLEFVVYTGLYCYVVSQLGHLERGWIKYAVMAVLLSVCAILGHVLQLEWAAWCAVIVLVLLFDLFYDEESFLTRWRWLLAAGVVVEAVLAAEAVLGAIVWTPQEAVRCRGIFLLLALLVYYDILFFYRRQKNTLGTILIHILYLFLILFAVRTANTLQIQGLGLLLFFCLEVSITRYKAGYERSTRSFQNQVMLQQYEEIKSVYLNMRGWRHDYHNHLQTMKAQLAMRQLEELAAYMTELEQELTSVDTYIKSGNLMADAILNSKLSLAEQKKIRLNSKVNLPEKLPVSDVDLCIILGNILDNAIEGCEKIPEEERFLRVYMAVVRQQLYISIQNSAKEEPDFEERHYITTKRGNHGLGLNRVRILVEKYQGFLNLQNEPGIFACEVTLPIEVPVE